MEPIAGHMRCCGFSAAADTIMNAQDEDTAQLQQAGMVRAPYCPVPAALICTAAILADCGRARVAHVAVVRICRRTAA